VRELAAGGGAERASGDGVDTPSFRGDAKHRTRNLEIPGLVLAHHPGMTLISQKFSTQGRNSSSQVQALRGCCNTFQ